MHKITPSMSIILSFRFLSCIIIAPYRNGTITPALRTVETTEISDSGIDKA